MLDIRNHKYKNDEKLPSDNELAEVYSVPRMKIRNVYKRLEQMGYIYSLQGRGRFLKENKETIDLVLSGNESFSKKMRESGFALSTMNLGCKKIPYDKKIYEELNIKEEDEVYKIERLRIVNGEPLAIHTSYLAKSIFNEINLEGNTITSMFDYYKDKGFKRYTTEKSILQISYPTTKERTYLKCGELVPILKLQTNCKVKDANLVLEYTEIIYRGDRFRYKI